MVIFYLHFAEVRPVRGVKLFSEEGNPDKNTSKTVVVPVSGSKSLAGGLPNSQRNKWKEASKKRAFKCVEHGVRWLHLDGLDTTHLKDNSWNCEIHSEAIKGTQLRWHSKSLTLKNFRGNSTSRIAHYTAKVQLLRPEMHVWLGWPGFRFDGLFVD